MVPCFPAREVVANEILLSESQTNLNSGKQAENRQATWLPTHPIIEGVSNAVKGFKFLTGFSGSGLTVCNAESGAPVYRDVDGARELMGITMKSKQVANACDDSLSFASTTRLTDWISETCGMFGDSDSDRFEPKPIDDGVCVGDRSVNFGEDCTPIEVSSPNYPGLYSNDNECSWNFKAPYDHQVIEIFRLKTKKWTPDFF